MQILAMAYHGWRGVAIDSANGPGFWLTASRGDDLVTRLGLWFRWLPWILPLSSVDADVMVRDGVVANDAKCELIVRYLRDARRIVANSSQL